MTSEKRTLVVLNYAMDETHPIFSHQIQAVNELSKHFSKVIVVTGSIGLTLSQENVEILSTNWVRNRRFFSLARYLVKIIPVLLRDQVIVFSHMTEVQSSLIAPITKLLGIPHWLWYAHKSKSSYLKWCHFWLNGIITSTPGSCPLESQKVYSVGQGVDPRQFPFSHSKKVFLQYPLIHFGRFDSSKNIHEILEACSRLIDLGINLQFTQLGFSSNDINLTYSHEVMDKYSNLNWVKFLPSISRNEVSAFLDDYFAFIHAYRGSLDKTLIECTLLGLPVVTLNSEYLDIFGSWSNNRHPSLTDELMALIIKDSNSLKVELSRRYQIAVKDHSLDHWAESISTLILGSLNKSRY